MKLAEKCLKTPSVNCVLEPEPSRAFNGWDDFPVHEPPALILKALIFLRSKGMYGAVTWYHVQANANLQLLQFSANCWLMAPVLGLHYVKY
jgi:hypothetical protein